METTRQQKISRLIQRDLGEIFQREARAVYNGAMITVTAVRVTKDLSLARVFLSIFAVTDKNVVFNKVKEHVKDTRVKLATRIRNQVRIIPELEFFMDDSLDYIENIEKLLKNK